MTPWRSFPWDAGVKRLTDVTDAEENDSGIRVAYYTAMQAWFITYPDGTARGPFRDTDCAVVALSEPTDQQLPCKIGEGGSAGPDRPPTYPNKCCSCGQFCEPEQLTRAGDMFFCQKCVSA